MRHLEHQLYQLVPIALGILIVAKAVMRRRRRGRHSSGYDAYIGSPQWRAVRRKALARAEHRCEHRGLLGRCPARSGLQVHHLHYRELGREWDGERTHGECLRVLCHPHHVRADVKRRRSRLRH